MAENTQDLPEPGLHGCDIFLLEQWKADSQLSPEDQMAGIFARFAQLSSNERWIYCLRGVHHDKGLLSQAEKGILALRRYEERDEKEFIILRTYYGPGSDTALAAVLENLDATAPDASWRCYSDATQYDYGDAWQRIFTRIPQLLERGGSPHDEYVAEQLAKDMECEREEKKSLEEQGLPWPEEATYLGDLYNSYHLAARVGSILILDEEAVRSTQTEEEDRKDINSYKRGPNLLLVWYDKDGKTVRWRRTSASEVDMYEGVLNEIDIDDMDYWTRAEIGDDYDWDGPRGPPSVED